MMLVACSSETRAGCVLTIHSQRTENLEVALVAISSILHSSISTPPGGAVSLTADPEYRQHR